MHYAPLYAYHTHTYTLDAAAAGVRGVVVVVPSGALRNLCRLRSLHTIYLARNALTRMGFSSSSRRRADDDVDAGRL